MLPPARPATPSIVLADDNRDSADTLALLLKARGIEVAVAYDGNEALRLIEELQPPMAILDIKMPGLSGYEVASACRLSGSLLVLVAMTAFGFEADVRAAFRAGFDYHLTKPVVPEELVLLASQLLAGEEVTLPTRGKARRMTA